MPAVPAFSPPAPTTSCEASNSKCVERFARNAWSDSRNARSDSRIRAFRRIRGAGGVEDAQPQVRAHLDRTPAHAQKHTSHERNLRVHTHTRAHRSINSARRCSKSRPAPSPPDARRRRPPDGRRLLRRLAPCGWALPSALYKIYISIYCLPIHIPVNRLPMNRYIACLCLNPFVMPSLPPSLPWLLRLAPSG